MENKQAIRNIGSKTLKSSMGKVQGAGGGDVQPQVDGQKVDGRAQGHDGVARIVKRNGRGRQGVRRDALLQLAISNFTVQKTDNLGVGAMGVNQVIGKLFLMQQTNVKMDARGRPAKLVVRVI